MRKPFLYVAPRRITYLEIVRIVGGLLRLRHCKHLTHHTTQLVREVRETVDGVVRVEGEVRTTCDHCQMILRRRDERPEDASTFGVCCDVARKEHQDAQ
jgi:hypothetical protein